MCLRVHESRVKSSYYHYHTTLSSHEFAVFNALGGSVDKISPTFFVFFCLCLQYLSEEFNCNISLWNKIDNVPCRLFISNIINCKPFRESEIGKVNYLGDINYGGNLKDRKKNGYFHIVTTFQMYVFHISTQRKERAMNFSLIGSSF